MADRVAVMRGGVLQQFDTPDRVYSHPANLFVAELHRQPGDEPRRRRSNTRHAHPLPARQSGH